MTPEELNLTSDEELFCVVDSMAGTAGDAAAAAASLHQPRTPYITLELLWRVHERVVHLKKVGAVSAAKHKLLARAVLCLTGVCLPPDDRDVDKIGNHLDIWLQRRYIEMDRRCRRNVRNAVTREEQRAMLRLQCCSVTGWGSVEEYRYVPSANEVECHRTHAPYVAYTRHLTRPPMTLLELKAEVNEARSDAISATAQLQREKERVAAAKRRRESAESEVSAAKKLIAITVKEKLEVEKQAAQHLKAQAGTQRAECRRLRRESAQAIRDAQARVLRLGSQAAAHARDAAVHAEGQAAVQRMMQVERERAELEVKKLKEQTVELHSKLASAQREGAKALKVAEAKVLRLSNQAASHAQELAIHAQHKLDAQQQLEEEQHRAEIQLEQLRKQTVELRSKLASAQRQGAKALQVAESKVLRLGSQAAAHAQEAAIHAQRAEDALLREEERKEELKEAQEESEYYREKAASETQTRRERAKLCAVALAQKEAIRDTSLKRLQARKEAEEQVDVLKVELDHVREELDAIRSREAADAGAAQKLAMMPTWQHMRKKGQRGGGLQLEHQHRVAILEQHANGTPASAIGRNIVATVKLAAPWLNPVEPTAREIRQIGFELTTLVEALSARKTASAFEIKLLGFDETTDRFKPVLTSNIQVRDTEGAPLDDVILKAAYLSTKGGESTAIVSEIEDKCFFRLRILLRLWKWHHESLFGEGSWSGPNPEQCSLYRLAGGGGLISDTCNAALKAKRLLRDLIQRQAESVFRAELGEDAWNALSEQERDEKLCVHLLDCQQHLRNIWLGHMSRKQADHVATELAAELKEFSSWERMTTDYDQLLRAVYKEFHEGGLYYKGKGAEFASWLREHHPRVFFMHIERAEGGRQDLDYDAAVPIYVNRRLLVEYLHSVVFGCNHKNILEDFLYQALCKEQFIAMSRANTIIDLRISRPHRWLAGKSAQLTDWSPIKMNGVLDLVDGIFQRARDNGEVLLDPELDVFAPIADTQPLFRAYREFTDQFDAVLSPDGSTRHLHYKLALAEALDPQDETNRRTKSKTVEYIQVQAAAALQKMYDPALAIANKLSSQQGVNSVAKQSKAHSDLKGCHTTNDATAESVYGAWKLERRRNPGISVRRSSGLAQARISKSLARADAVRRRASRLTETARTVKKSSSKRSNAMFGYFHQLPFNDQVSLVEMCRAERVRQRRLDQEDEQELDAFRAARRKCNSELELEALKKNFALALSFFDRYIRRAVKTPNEMRRALDRLESDQLRLDWLREQVEMRVVGLGWVEFKKQWSSGSDANVGTIPNLIDHLKVILEEEAERQIPTAAPAPIMQRKTFKALGTATVQAEELSDQRLSLTAAQMLEAANNERARLEACGELDTVGDLQPAKPPPLNESLVGRRLEIRWRYWRNALPGERGQKKQEYIWCEGTVAEVSDGTIRKSKRSKESLPAGALRIRWPADKDFDEKETLIWSILNPDDWCKDVHLGWRWAACELKYVAQERSGSM